MKSISNLRSRRSQTSALLVFLLILGSSACAACVSVSELKSAISSCNSGTASSCSLVEQADTSGIADMSDLFCGLSTFNADISRWNTGNVNNMNGMFYRASAFNADISLWDTSSVTDMTFMFGQAESFNAPISRWNTAKVTSMRSMFSGASAFSQDLCQWSLESRTSSVVILSMFTASPLEGVPHGCRASCGDNVAGDGEWYADCGGVHGCVGGCATAVTSEQLRGLVHACKTSASAPQSRPCAELERVDTGSVTSMSGLFANASFTADLSGWNTASVQDMSGMFERASSFGCSMSGWDTSKVTSMSHMFDGAESFNCDLSRWDTGSVQTMSFMFRDAQNFNADISEWDMTSVTTMRAMFLRASSFNADLCPWDLGNRQQTDREEMLAGSPLEAVPYGCDFCASDASNNCHAATCTLTTSSFVCTCDDGFVDWNDGTGCDVDQCRDGSHNCDLQAACTDSDGSFTCECRAGFAGNGVECADVDECISEVTHECHTDATCTNSIASFTCACNAGFRGDGIECVKDQCNHGGEQQCAAQATCISTPDGFECKCNVGFSGSGTSCSEDNECILGTHNCDPQTAECSNTEGSFRCTCNSGFVLLEDGVTCDDVKECGVSDNCDDQALCDETPGSFTCACKDGFREWSDGTVCDRDQCLDDASDCSAATTCRDTATGFVCEQLPNCRLTTLDACVVTFTASLDAFSEAQFDEALQRNYRSAVASAVGVAEEQVVILEVRASVAGRRMLRPAAIEVVTAIATTGSEATFLSANLEAVLTAALDEEFKVTEVTLLVLETENDNDIRVDCYDAIGPPREGDGCEVRPESVSYCTNLMLALLGKGPACTEGACKDLAKIEKYTEGLRGLNAGDMVAKIIGMFVFCGCCDWCLMKCRGALLPTLEKCRAAADGFFVFASTAFAIAEVIWVSTQSPDRELDQLSEQWCHNREKDSAISDVLGFQKEIVVLASIELGCALVEVCIFWWHCRNVEQHWGDQPNRGDCLYWLEMLLVCGNLVLSIVDFGFSEAMFQTFDELLRDANSVTNGDSWCFPVDTELLRECSGVGAQATLLCLPLALALLVLHWHHLGRC